MEQYYIVEARLPDGSLNVKDCTVMPYEFIHGCNMQYIFTYFFYHNKGKESASQEEVRKWYNDKGWFIREKTW